MMLSRYWRPYLLHYSATVHASCKLQYAAFHPIRKNLLLRLVAVLEEFLNYVVAKDILHQLQAILLELPEDFVLFVTVRSFELLLDEPRSMLISAELHNVSENLS